MHPLPAPQPSSSLCPQRLSVCQDTASLCIRQAGPGREDRAQGGKGSWTASAETTHLPLARAARKGRDPHSHCTPTVCPAQNQMQQPSGTGAIISTSRLKKPDPVRPHSRGCREEASGSQSHISLRLQRKHPQCLPRSFPYSPLQASASLASSCSWERVKSTDAHLEWGPGTCAFSKPANVSMHSQV